MPGVEFYGRDGLACITLSNEAGANALTLEVLAQLEEHLATLPADTRALVLRSSASVFSFGMSLNEAAKDSADRQQLSLQASRAYARLLARLYQLPLPTIALVRGPCKAGGVGLLAVCDLVLSTAAARFQLSETLLGLVPANLSPYLAQRIGVTKLLQLSLSIDEIDAHSAQQLGLTDYLVEDDQQLEKKARRLLRNIFRCSPAALAEMKVFARRLPGQSWSEQLAESEQLLARLLQSEETRQAVIDLQEGGLPSWSQHFSPSEPLVG